MSRMPAIGSGAGFLPGQIDSAETFAESDVTVTTSQTRISNESVQLDESTQSGPVPSQSTVGLDGPTSGVVINPNTTLSGVSLELGDDYSSSMDVELQESDGTTIDSVTGQSVNTRFRLEGVLQSGTQYRLAVTGMSGDYIPYYGGNEPPLSSTPLDVVDYFGTGASDHWSSFNYIDGIVGETEGSATVEWPYPKAVYAWGSAFFEAAEDGETVEVYVEEYDGSSWNEIAGPITNTTEIPGEPSRNIRFRVDFSRASVANNPRLSQIHRQEVLANA